MLRNRVTSFEAHSGFGWLSQKLERQLFLMVQVESDNFEGWVGGWYGGEVLRGDIRNDFTCRSRAKNAFISLNRIRNFEIVMQAPKKTETL